VNQSVPNRKCVVFCMLSLVAVGIITVTGIKAEVSKPDVGEIVELQQRIRAEAADKRALEVYEKRNTEVAYWAEDTTTPNPDNAALLYYQAFMLLPEIDITTSRKIDEVLTGAEPDRYIRTYLGRCLHMIQVGELASRTRHCNWGVPNERGRKFSESALRSGVWDLSRILLLDAVTLAADEHYRAALERCLSVRRLANHLSEDSDLDLLARNPDFLALRTIRRVLGVMPPDADILAWLRGQLAIVQGMRLSFAEMLQEKYRSFFILMRTNPATIERLKNLLIEAAANEQAKENIRNLTNEQLLSRACGTFPRLFSSIFRVVDSEMTYEQKVDQMHKSYQELMEEDSTDTVIKYVILLSGTQGMIDSQYPFIVGHQAHINGIKAAVEVYLELAKTGNLPEKLPDYLPKDPFTGQDFDYEITDEGFALRCQGEEFLRRKNQFLEFKVHKERN
jgi:hypothetical protein